MSQTSDDTRAYPSWNRTPGKPNNSSSNLNTKMSNISSSTDSGVGRTPNWNSDNDCKFGLMESNPWSNNNVIQSPDSIDSFKKLSWEDNSKLSNNLTFGFSSVGNEASISSNHNPTWGLPPTSPGDYLTNESNKLDNCWNLPSCQTGDSYLLRSSSIWSTNTQRPFSDHDSEHNTTTSSSTIDMNLSSHNYPPTITATSNKLESDAKCEMPLICAFNNDEAGEKILESKTWAQAAGKTVRDIGGLRTSGSSDDECGGGISVSGTGAKKELDEEYQTIINRVEGWGSHTVDQSTPWVLEDTDPTLVNVCANDANNSLNSLTRSTTESNVWTNEPPNGVGVWESHYENIGEKTSRWNNVGVPMKAKSGWEVPEAAVSAAIAIGSASSGGQWNERDCDNCVWTAPTNMNSESRINKTPWMSTASQAIKPDSQSCLVAPIGSRSIAITNINTQTHAFPLQRNNSAVVLPRPVSPISSDLPEPRQFYPSQMISNTNNNSSISNNRTNPNVKMRPMMNLGFRKEDAQGALYNNNNGMDVNRVMNHNSSMMNQPRNEWGVVPDNYRGGSGDMEPCMMTGGGGVNSGAGSGGYMQAQQSMLNNGPSMSAAQSSTFKHIHLQQQMTAMGQRLAPDNQMVFEKQIIKEITQLQAKQQDLLQRINGLRSIAGSQVIIQEMTRTLVEVRQQLTTQQATLKVIRRELMPNGVMNSVGGGGATLQSMYARAMQPQSSSSDLSQHMADMKIQKRNMELWPSSNSHGNLPSPNTISPYIGMDKQSALFYNTSGNQLGGPPPPLSQTYGYSNSNPGKMGLPHSNYVTTPSQPLSTHHRSMWPASSRPEPPPAALHTFGGPNNDDCDSAAPSTTALSLSQTLLSSSTGNSVSSAFTTRDISFASANISEFVPGQPWPGISYSQRDDPNITLGTGQRSLLSVTNDHLEKLANSNLNSLNIPNDVGANNGNMNRVSTGINGTTNSSASIVTYVLIRDLPSHINIEMLRNALTPQSFPGLVQMQPNLAARWVLLHFTSNEETLKAFNNLRGKVGAVELVPDQEVNQRIQYNPNCTVGPMIPHCSGMMDFHNQQSQSHYLH